MGGHDGPVGPRRASRLRRGWRWFARTFGAQPHVESEGDLVAVREAVSLGEVQVLAAKLHANEVATWVSTGAPGITAPVSWPTTSLPALTRHVHATARGSLHVQRRDVERAQALLSEPSPFDEDGDPRPQVP